MHILICALILSALLAIIYSAPTTCPALYRRYSSVHTYCKPPNAQCSVQASSVSEEDKDLIVKVHNEYRSRVAMGEEDIGPLPSAADMLEMEWDDELAKVAQKHAEQCVFDHDCNECRKIKNFDVGQNLFQFSTTSKAPITPNWRRAIKDWYDEVKDFDPDTLTAFDSSSSENDIGHFTQAIWAKTWKVGCGYTLYPEDGLMYELYTCNYGPSGNVDDVPLYEQGEPCSNCPENTCCGDVCIDKPSHHGLCKVAAKKRPVYYPQTAEYSYFCDFQNPAECQLSVPKGMKKWEISHTLSGSYVGIVLKGGETAILNITTPFKALPAMCVSLEYRKGPNVADEKTANVAKELYYLTSGKYAFETKLSRNAPTFTKFGMNLNFKQDLRFSLVFTVPEDTPEQYFEVTNIFVKSGSC